MADYPVDYYEDQSLNFDGRTRLNSKHLNQDTKDGGGDRKWQDCPKDNIHQETGGVSVAVALHSWLRRTKWNNLSLTHSKTKWANNIVGGVITETD